MFGVFPHLNPGLGQWACNQCTYLNQPGTLQCEMCNSIIPPTPTPTKLNQEEPQSTLSTSVDNRLCGDMSKLMLDENGFTDVTFELPQGKELKAHRNIIAARCPKLRAMLTEYKKQHPQEKKAVLHIDTPASLFEELLKFIYTGGVPAWGFEKEPAVLLLKVAHEYSMQSLKDLCADHIVDQKVANHDAVDLLRVAFECEVPKLQQAAVAHITQNWNKTFKRQEFLKLPHEALIMLIRQTILPLPINDFVKPTTSFPAPDPPAPSFTFINPSPVQRAALFD